MQTLFSGVSIDNVKKYEIDPKHNQAYELFNPDHPDQLQNSNMVFSAVAAAEFFKILVHDHETWNSTGVIIIDLGMSIQGLDCYFSDINHTDKGVSMVTGAYLVRLLNKLLGERDVQHQCYDMNGNVVDRQVKKLPVLLFSQHGIGQFHADGLGVDVNDVAAQALGVINQLPVDLNELYIDYLHKSAQAIALGDKLNEMINYCIENPPQR
jgi:hypothetical protein